jgi:hypothetical protein
MIRALALTLLTVLSLATQADEPQNKPILSLQYGFYLGGLNNGTVYRHLYQTGENRYEFHTQIVPRGLAAWYLNKTMYQRTTFQVTAKGVLPLRYEYFEKGKKTVAPILIEFDWVTRRAKQSKPLEREWAINEQFADNESSLFSIIYYAIHQQTRFEIHLLNGKKAKPVTYKYEIIAGRQKLETDLGPLEVIYIREDKPKNTKLVNKTWLAPGLGYVPVRIDQDIKGEPDLSMRLQKIEAQDPSILTRILAR